MALTAPSRRAPQGLPRCTRQEQRRAGWWQCTKPARDGFPVCWKHGAGSEKREREGRRQNPAVAGMLAGGGVPGPETLAKLLELNPEYAALYQQHLNSPALLDFRPLLARARATLDLLEREMLRAMTPPPEGEDGAPPIEGEGLFSFLGPFAKRAAPVELLEAMIKNTRHVVWAAAKMIEMETKMGPLTHADAEAMVRAFAATLNEFVVPERLEDARAFCRAELRKRRLESQVRGDVRRELAGGRREE